MVSAARTGAASRSPAPLGLRRHLHLAGPLHQGVLGEGIGNGRPAHQRAVVAQDHHLAPPQAGGQPLARLALQGDPFERVVGLPVAVEQPHWRCEPLKIHGLAAGAPAGAGQGADLPRCARERAAGNALTPSAWRRTPRTSPAAGVGHRVAVDHLLQRLPEQQLLDRQFLLLARQGARHLGHLHDGVGHEARAERNADGVADLRLQCVVQRHAGAQHHEAACSWGGPGTPGRPPASPALRARLRRRCTTRWCPCASRAG
ncbi:MAG: hypothetical protein JWP65_2332 [Ramlibacter sp.]|nr:hypothetical protein [Ramlibacter sp.]